MTSTTPFSKSEWESEYATDMSYPGVSAALGEEAGAGPVVSVTARHLLAVAYAAREHEKLLELGPGAFVVVWELAIDRRASSTPEPEPDRGIAFTAAKARASSHASRCAVGRGRHIGRDGSPKAHRSCVVVVRACFWVGLDGIDTKNRAINQRKRKIM